MLDSLLALERQRGIPASFSLSSFSPCNHLRSGILRLSLWAPSLSFPFTLCHIHTGLVSPPLASGPPSSLQVIAAVHPASNQAEGLPAV